MNVLVIYAKTNSQFIMQVECQQGATVRDIILQSGVLQQYPEISLDSCQVGIFSELVSLDVVPEDNDRIEIYRSLVIDPMEARRIRAREEI